MESEDWDLLLNFVVREKRYLKIWETSLGSKNLEEGERVFKKAVREINSAMSCLNRKEIKKTRICRDAKDFIVTKVSRKISELNKKQISFIIDHFDLFKSVFTKSPKQDLIQSSCELVDRYYSPKRHVYR